MDNPVADGPMDLNASFIELTKGAGRNVVRALLRLPVRGRSRLKHGLSNSLRPSGDGVERVEIGPCVVALSHDYEATRNMAYGVYETGELRIVKRFVRPGDVIVDVGANVGYMAAHFSGFVGPEGLVYAFEPGSTPFRMLQGVADSNRFGNMEIFRCAVSDREGGRTFYETENILARGYGRLDERPSAKFSAIDEQQVQATSLDLFFQVRSVELSRLRLVKIDVEGHEDAVIDGMKWIFGEGYRPFLLTELSISGERRCEQSYPEVLLALGYRAFSCRSGRPAELDVRALPAGFHGNVFWMGTAIAE